MDDNITRFRAIDGAKDERPTPLQYDVYYWLHREDDITLSSYIGFAASTDNMFYLVDKDLVMRFMVPLTRLVRVETSDVKVEYVPSESEIN